MKTKLHIGDAAKACGGIVIAQVERIVKAGSLHPKSVKVPGVSVDYVVVSQPENHMQTITTQFNAALCGDVRVPVNSLAPMALDERKVIARRTALELKPGAITNLGIGIPAGVPSVAAAAVAWLPLCRVIARTMAAASRTRADAPRHHSKYSSAMAAVSANTSL